MATRAGAAGVMIRLGARIVIGVGLASLILFTIAIAAEPLLVVRSIVEPADVIVVLGGDARGRAAKAAALYHAGAAPRVLVSGSGDCDDIRRALVAGGVTTGSIRVECASRNTWENARLSSRLLRSMGVKTAILVTSWFHTRRAIACFQHFSPQIHWMSSPVEPNQPSWMLAGDREIADVRIAEEYLKIGWYAVRYGLWFGISPAAARELADDAK